MVFNSFHRRSDLRSLLITEIFHCDQERSVDMAFADNTKYLFTDFFEAAEQREGFVYEIQIIVSDVLWHCYNGERTALRKSASKP